MACALTILCLLKDSNRQFSTIFPHSNGCSCLWTERTSGSWRWEKQRSLNTNQRTMRDEELYTFPCSISFCRVSWNYAMNECIIHFIKYLSTYVKQKITFCFCEQCLLYLSNFAGDHPLVQPAVQHERIKKSCQSWKYSPPAFIINMHWNWTFVKSLPNAEYLTWLKINMEWTFLFINLTKLIGLPKPLLNCLSKYQNM